MIGNNTMELNGATMCQIVQHYFNTVLFAEGKAPVVDEVRGTGNGTFVVKTEAPAKEADK
jgi:hypothetical protein